MCCKARNGRNEGNAVRRVTCYLSHTTYAGGLSGALFRSPRGPRQALAAGAVGALAGTGITLLRQVFPSL